MTSVRKQFEGFSRPQKNFFQMPNEWTDITAGISSLAELKVVEYVLRHTWGFQEFGIAKRITIDEFMEGRKRKDGSRMDQGTGLSKPSVIDGVKKAVAQGYLLEHVDDRDKARIKKSYELRMAGGNDLNADVKNLDPPVQNLDSGGSESLPRTGKDTAERHFEKPVAKGKKSPVLQLPRLDQADDKIDAMASHILETLGDSHSRSFYRHVPARIPDQVILQALSQTKLGSDHPPRVFTKLINDFARDQLQQRLSAAKNKIMRSMSYGS